MSWKQALSLADVARELGKSEDWLGRHWRQLVKDKALPKPILANHLVWSAAQVYAVLDKDLTPVQRVAAAAYRAAEAAARATVANDSGSVAAHRVRLDRQFGTPPAAANQMGD